MARSEIYEAHRFILFGSRQLDAPVSALIFTLGLEPSTDLFKLRRVMHLADQEAETNRDA